MPVFRCVERAAVGYNALHMRPSAWGPMKFLHCCLPQCACFHKHILSCLFQLLILLMSVKKKKKKMIAAVECRCYIFLETTASLLAGSYVISA